ncbi:hypothetical protein BECAL_00530 [Bellilinea caldifistulae]|uniref:DUF3267 domain-containing protein n=1 Tax=Bellilinea caldifistulae TaxID=360411 RepID=UPI000781CE0B|nr:DUF3267 domain-containing protein [Bellilinea caldifistulae]GAP09386.1 hypothetical protein BECAL_00530 [Bellilinea caldifistulae]
MRQAVRTLPSGYEERGRFTLKSRSTLLMLNLFGLGLVLASAWFFITIASFLRPEAEGLVFVFRLEGLQSLLFLLLLIVTIVLTLILHEAVHGLGFWLLAGVKPKFAFRGTYAYAAAPGWYIPANIYFWIGIAPLVVLSLLAIALIALVPLSALTYVILAAVMNFSGAVGDIWVAIQLLRAPRGSLALDQGDDITLFAPSRSSAD